MKDKRYIIGVIVAIVVAFIAIVLIVSKPSSNRVDKPAKDKVPAAVNLTKYANSNSRTEYTTQGRIVGDNQFQSVRISVSATERKVEVMNGYENSVVSSQTFPNNSAAYSTFLEALKQASYASKQTSLQKDFRGVCPLGRRYVYILEDPGSKVVDTWSTTCSKTGTFAGNASLTRQLFQAQIPNYNRLTSAVRL